MFITNIYFSWTIITTTVRKYFGEAIVVTQ